MPTSTFIQNKARQVQSSEKPTVLRFHKKAIYLFETNIGVNMKPTLSGIHHVTAISSGPHKNLAFYTQLLGLRLVKKTVNFDDNYTYHLYYGDKTGTPGSIMTFFPWAHARRGTHGHGLADVTAFSIPIVAVDFWKNRLTGAGLDVSARIEFEKTVLAFADHDGLLLELVADGEFSENAWATDEIPAEMAIKQFFGVALSVPNAQATETFLVNVLGFHLQGRDGNCTRFEIVESGNAAVVDVVEDARFKGRFGAGIVHHVAFRVQNDAEQLAWIKHLRANGVPVTEVRDRQYFRSIYFNDPSGIIFEIATDEPGFLVDESFDTLGKALKLPSWIEPRRAELEMVLPVLE
jgi:glyoxalase family protein